MTTTRLSGPPGVDRVMCSLAWISQAGIAATYLAVISQPAVWRPIYTKEPVSAVCLWIMIACMALLWANCLWLEQKKFYNRRLQRLHHNGNLFGHLTLLFIAMVAATEQPGRAAIWIVLPVLSFFTIALWIGWMHILFLPPEDQAVIDAIAAREAEQRAAIYDASEKELRRQRLTQIVSSLGYQLTDTQPSATGQDETAAPAARWQIPTGKHAPLVYFIRNGNRLKIGTSTELKRRIRTLALRPENVVLLVSGGQDIERAFHRQFADLRIGNTEWFAYEGALVDFVNTENHRIREEQAK